MGSYIEGTLGNGEVIVIKARVSVADIVGTWIFGIIFCWLLLIPLINAIIKTVQWAHIELALTNKAVRGKVGVFNTRTLAVPLDKIQTINVNQTFWGKVFGYGTISITSAAAGSGSSLSFRMIKGATEFKAATMSAMHDAQEESMRKQADYMAQAMAQAMNRQQ